MRAAWSPAADGYEKPIFSPDGGMIAFTGEYDDNVDVYVIAAAGGAADAADLASRRAT